MDSTEPDKAIQESPDRYAVYNFPITPTCHSEDFVKLPVENAAGAQDEFSHGSRGNVDAQFLGCDKQRAGTPNHRHGVPALPLVTPYKLTNSPAARFFGNS